MEKLPAAAALLVAGLAAAVLLVAGLAAVVLLLGLFLGAFSSVSRLMPRTRAMAASWMSVKSFSPRSTLLMSLAVILLFQRVASSAWVIRAYVRPAWMRTPTFLAAIVPPIGSDRLPCAGVVQGVCPD